MTDRILHLAGIALALLFALPLLVKGQEICGKDGCPAGVQLVSSAAPMPVGPHAPALVMAPAPTFVKGGHLHPIAALAHAIRNHVGLIRCQMMHAKEAVRMRAHAPVRTALHVRPVRHFIAAHRPRCRCR